MVKKIITIWKNKWKIFEGFYTKLFKMDSPEIRKTVKERLTICRSNKCGLYDAKGESVNAIIKGTESCGGCGCVLSAKVSCLSCNCFLKDLGQEPLWEATNLENES